MSDSPEFMLDKIKDIAPIEEQATTATLRTHVSTILKFRTIILYAKHIAHIGKTPPTKVHQPEAKESPTAHIEPPIKRALFEQPASSERIDATSWTTKWKNCFMLQFRRKKYKWRLKQENSKTKSSLSVTYGFYHFRKENRLKPGTNCIFTYYFDERAFYLY